MIEILIMLVGVEKDEREFRFFICSCLLKCSERLSEEARRSAWSKFWASGSYAAQMGFIAANIQEICIKHKRVLNSTRKQYAQIYSIENVQVCRDVFMHTLRVSTHRINTALKKLKRSPDMRDKRGSVSGGRNALPRSTVKRVKAHINQFPRYISHYTREKSSKEYLNPDFTVPLMFKLFKEKYPKIHCSFSSYNKILITNFNLCRKRCQKDTS